jgi:hypothetical protein
VYIEGNYAFVADWYSGLAIIDISDPTNPGSPVYENTAGNAIDVYVSGDYAYVADELNGLAIIDISDPTNPGTPVYEDTTGNAADVFVSGNYAYVADYDSGLAIVQVRLIDIIDPIFTDTPSDFSANPGYTGQTISWMASDPNPGTYSIELDGRK